MGWSSYLQNCELDGVTEAEREELLEAIREASALPISKRRAFLAISGSPTSSTVAGGARSFRSSATL